MDNNTNIIEHLEWGKLEIISISRNTKIEENFKKDTPSSTLVENLSTCNITETINEEILPPPPIKTIEWCDTID